MAKYLYQASYTSEGVKGLQKDKGSGRKTAIEKAVEGLGGKVECLYFSFGKFDIVFLADMPDNVTASAFALAAGSTGMANVMTTPLLTIADVDKACGMSVSYRPPGK